MGNEQNLARVADLFKALGNESRLGILVALDGEAMSVGMLAEQTQMSQPSFLNTFAHSKPLELFPPTDMARK